MFINPITGNFNRVNRINGWAKLAQVTTKTKFVRSKNEWYVSFPPIDDNEQLVRIENKPCFRPFVAIRRWKIWLMANIYRDVPCYYCTQLKINQL